MIRLDSSQFGCYLIVNDDGEDLLIQSDWEFPATASTFGWSPCVCGFTDGTIDCEHKTATDMIEDAREYLDDNIGKTTEDPGYFDTESDCSF